MSPKESKISRFIRAPIRVLSKARDLYVKSMLNCAGEFTYASAMGCPTPQTTSLPRSFSVNSTVSSSDEDFRELIRASSTRSLTGKIETEILRSKQLPGVLKVVPRSQTVTVGRIDEDKPCEFVEDVAINPNLYPRSRSYAPPSRSKMF
ncbi:uncharacterized protein LOC111366447 [Olea europaea var. sylvestris]|uniref:Uncharacterized protein n=1 Tax=Olea europaea subsp. europaea TaxID=158383 RepID=A0A8S0TYL1_OLEEU|nr:uncharacterized protein LOC111366447 [Olea europaea var. sylvestris]CAA3011442.1 Hypothetical predicted protein [Olea europaea subsp. europaea]